MLRQAKYLLAIILTIAGCTPENPPVSDGKVIILMYHRITEGGATNLYERSAADFESDLQFLKQNNIQVIGFEDLGEMSETGKAPDSDCAIITFDDGDHSWITFVKPLLIEYRMEATFYLWAAKMGSNSFLSWDEVSLMSHYLNGDGERQFFFGSHTLNHLYLEERKASFTNPADFDGYLDEELEGSKNLIEAHTPVDVTSLSLPFGSGAGDADIMAGAVRNGYRYLRTSEWGAIDIETVNLLRLPSIPILNSADISIIEQYLND